MSQTTTLRAPKQAAAPAFRAEWTTPPNDVHPTGTLRVVIGRETSYYDVTELSCEFDGCRGFCVTKHTTEREQYHVLLSANGQDQSCECLGFLRWGTPCRHIRALREVLTNG